LGVPVEFGGVVYFWTMFVRKKRNPSGVISIQIIDKSSGKYEVFRTVGSSAESVEIDLLVKKAKLEILEYSGQTTLAFDQQAELEFADTFINHIDSLCLVGPELLLGKIFDQIGFNDIEDDLFRHLVITRLVYPVSKLKTVDYLFKYKGVQISVYSIYRYLDKLHTEQKKRIQQISLQHTLQLLGNNISVVFYDVTTLYFEAADEDDFRKTGFSKDGKHQQPQIVLGLLVSEGGYPLDYDVFEGSKYEGDTLIPVIEHFVAKHQIQELTVVADAGLLSNKNIKALQAKQYHYILGGRIKNESVAIKQSILCLQLQDQQSTEIIKEDHIRLIVNYKQSRADKDAHNRKKGLESLEKKVKTGVLTKNHINNKGYNKYLKLEGKASIKIDYEKYNEDAKWDGLKGYVTNTTLLKEAVIEKYSQLWLIEKAFRISKSDLQIRPVYHRLKKRIEAHICISFAACKIYKELDRQLKELNSQCSPEKAIDIIKTIYKVSFQTPYSNKIQSRLLLKTDEQRNIVKLFNLDK
jgi:transposase